MYVLQRDSECEECLTGLPTHPTGEAHPTPHTGGAGGGSEAGGGPYGAVRPAQGGL